MYLRTVAIWLTAYTSGSQFTEHAFFEIKTPLSFWSIPSPLIDLNYQHLLC